MIMLNKKNLTKEEMKKLMDRIIWPKDRDSANPCLEWIGSVDKFDRPLYRLNGVYVKARILVYECFYGPLEENQTLVPTCFTQKCVNPTHLTLEEFSNWRKKIIDLPNEVEKNMMNSVVTEILHNLP